eukprot:4785352-Lingulodinium_polyedra.AAC.1
MHNNSNTLRNQEFGLGVRVRLESEDAGRYQNVQKTWNRPFGHRPLVVARFGPLGRENCMNFKPGRACHTQYHVAYNTRAQASAFIQE